MQAARRRLKTRKLRRCYRSMPQSLDANCTCKQWRVRTIAPCAQTRRELTMLEQTGHHGPPGTCTILYGFRMPCGSIVLFNVAIKSTASAVFEKPMTSRFLKPMPCSAEMDPRTLLVHSHNHGSSESMTSFLYSGPVMFKCRL